MTNAAYEYDSSPVQLRSLVVTFREPAGRLLSKAPLCDKYGGVTDLIVNGVRQFCEESPIPFSPVSGPSPGIGADLLSRGKIAYHAADTTELADETLRLLQSVPVLAYPAPDTGDSLVRSIVAPHLPGGQDEVMIRIPMAVERFPAREVYDQAVAEIGAHLDAGRDVAFVCEGDPFFYGSFMFLFGRMAEKYPVEVVPGVSSLTAAAAVLRSPLAARNDVLTVIPAPIDDVALRRRLADADAAAIIKVGRHLERIRAILEDMSLSHCSRYVERATMAEEKVLRLDEVAPGGAPYFSIILVHKRGTAWQ